MSEQLVKRSTTIHLNGTPDEVFPLFTPVGEYKWIPGWQPELIYPPSGEAMTNNVFITQHAGQAKTIWVTLDYDAEAYHAEYVNIAPGLQSVRIEIQCRAVDGGTEARVTHTLIAIGAAGYAEVASYTDALHAERIGHWETAINYYLEHNALIPVH